MVIKYNRYRERMCPREIVLTAELWNKSGLLIVYAEILLLSIIHINHCIAIRFMIGEI